MKEDKLMGAVAAPSYRYRTTVERLVDGDTLYLKIDLGFRVTTVQPVRLAGINAPEMNTIEGKAALGWLAAKLLGKELRIESQKGDKYGRWLGTIYIVGEDTSVNAQMVDAGVAVVYVG